MDQRVDGACLCGALQFSILLPTLWCGHCHCRSCRRAHGAAFVTWVGVADAQFAIEESAPLHWHSASAGAERGFCRDCGSKMFFRSTRWPGEIHVTLANLQAPIDRMPQAHFYDDHRVDWIDLGDSLPRRTTVDIERSEEAL